MTNAQYVIRTSASASISASSGCNDDDEVDADEVAWIGVAAKLSTVYDNVSELKVRGVCRVKRTLQKHIVHSSKTSLIQLDPIA